ncbi:hypothetical protein [Rhodopila sp.]|uniref:hypothetical protein n=1 Tax=Rhodopila sp. TaxID=2480087 RepID=UPI003D0EF802
MAQRTIAHMYDDYQDAQTVVTNLEAAGIPHGDISLVANAEARGRSAGTSDTHTGTAGGTGAVLGTAVGGGVGLLAGIGALAIPGVGPVVAAGWLIATLTGAGIGAASGGLVGALTGAGVSSDEANVYAQGVKGGGSLVTVRVNDTDATRVEEVMGRQGPVDWQQRRASYGSDWSGFNPAAAGSAGDYSADAEREVPGPGADGSYVPGTDPGRRL